MIPVTPCRGGALYESRSPKLCGENSEPSTAPFSTLTPGLPRGDPRYMRLQECWGSSLELVAHCASSLLLSIRRWYHASRANVWSRNIGRKPCANHRRSAC